MNNVKTLGDWLKVKRLAKNLTPGHVAAKMDITVSLVYSWESGSRQPDTHQMKILATILEFNPAKNHSDPLRDFRRNISEGTERQEQD